MIGHYKSAVPRHRIPSLCVPLPSWLHDLSPPLSFRITISHSIIENVYILSHSLLN